MLGGNHDEETFRIDVDRIALVSVTPWAVESLRQPG
jgi:hypothetical protein